MSILSASSVLDNPDPPSQADHDALGALCCTPADHLAGDWLGAILADLEPTEDEQHALEHVETMVMFGDMLLRHAIGRASITWLDGDTRRLWTLWNRLQA